MKLLIFPTPTRALLVGGAILLLVSGASAQQKPPAPGQNKAPGQTAQGAQGTGDATAFAQIGDAAPKKRFLVPPVDAPLDIPLKATNYPVPNGAIFASPDAKPDGTGTRNSPMTFQAALQSAPEGATIVLRGGAYRESKLLIPHKLTIQAAPGELPWLDGSDIVAGWVKDGKGAYRHDDWNVGFPPIFDSKDIEPDYPLANNRDMVWLNGKYLTQVGSRAEVGPSQFFVDYAGKKLFLGDDPTGKTVEATTRANGLMGGGAKVAGSIVRGLGFRRFADAGFQTSAPRVVLENCTSVWNGIFGVQITGSGTPNSTTDVTLRGLNASCNGKAGVRAWGTPRLLVENSTFTHNNIENYRTAWGAAGLKLGNGTHLVFRNNLVANNYSFGLWLDENANDALVVNNRMSGNRVAGIMFGISHRDVFAFNTIHDNNVGMMISNSTQGQVWNNTFADNKTGLVIKQGKRLNHQTEADPDDFFLTREIALHNNLFAGTKPQKGAVFIDAGTGRASGAEMITASDSNLYALAAPVKIADWLAGGKKNEFAGLAAFQEASALEKRSVVVAQNPFVNAAQGDFRLQAGVLKTDTETLPAEVAKAAGVAPDVGYVGALRPAA